MLGENELLEHAKTIASWPRTPDFDLVSACYLEIRGAIEEATVELRAENAALREALKAIAERFAEEPNLDCIMALLCSGDLDYGQLRDAVYDAQAKARAALEKK